MGEHGPISSAIADFVHEQRLGFHATVSPDGTPNLSPKGTTAVLDDRHLIFADIRSPRTLANLAANASIEVNVVDPITRRGYRFKGVGRAHTDDETLERAFAAFEAADYAVTRERTRAVVVIRVETLAPLTSPAYDDGSSVADVAEPWARGVIDRAERWLPPSLRRGDEPARQG